MNDSGMLHNTVIFIVKCTIFDLDLSLCLTIQMLVTVCKKDVRMCQLFVDFPERERKLQAK